MPALYDAIIIGAGISGLTLASRLRQQNKNFIILEKSAGVGGRIATRRGDDCAYDHGAQFIKIKPNEKNPWQEFLKIQEKGKVWFSSSETDYIVFPKGLTQFAKILASPLEVRLNEKILHIDIHDDFSTIESDTGTRYNAKQLFITCPLPQSLSLLKHSKISYPLELDEIHYASALVGLFRVQSFDKNISNITYLQDVSEEIYSVSNQLSKEVSQNLAFTVVMKPTWSERYFDQDDAASLLKISTAFQSALKQVGSQNSYAILNSQLKKWRYSHPLQIAKSPFQSLDDSKRIFLLGDAFGGGSIQGAIRSAWSIPLAE